MGEGGGNLSEAIDRVAKLAEYVGYSPEPVSPQELIAYISGETYEQEEIENEEILSDDLLLLHEIAEISELKRMGYVINEETVMKAYPRTYEAHLTAMEVELEAAHLLDRKEHIRRRAMDLRSYLEDEHLPHYLRSRVLELISLAESFLNRCTS